jgi:hypothetical protein
MLRNTIQAGAGRPAFRFRHLLNVLIIFVAGQFFYQSMSLIQ